MGAESFIFLRDENPKPVLGMLTVDTAAGGAGTCVQLFMWLHFLHAEMEWSWCSDETDQNAIFRTLT